ncbi:ABC transporter ATP-binding protein [Verrucomicrobiales bacterium BCK34]|nr:ABC transporter ATP-binding protein [Verrucomicrobiales bacterium BCK34]
MHILDITNVSKSYGETPVLRDISYSVDQGERIALMGPSGSGKSTLLNCIGGIDRPDRGHIKFDGRLLSDFDEEQLCQLRREELSTVFQFFHLLPTLTARENIEFPLQLIGLGRKEREPRVSDIIDKVGLSHRADAMPAQLSGGEMQRVAIARALSIQPRLILADEPTGNLDTQTGDSILQLLEGVSDQYGVAMVLVTHSKAATRICHRVLQMRDGMIKNSSEPR